MMRTAIAWVAVVIVWGWVATEMGGDDRKVWRARAEPDYIAANVAAVRRHYCP